MKIVIITRVPTPIIQNEVGASQSDFWDNIVPTYNEPLTFNGPNARLAARGNFPAITTLTERVVNHVAGHSIAYWTYTDYQGEGEGDQVKEENKKRAQAIYTVIAATAGVQSNDAVIVHSVDFPKDVVPKAVARTHYYAYGGPVDDFAWAVKSGDPHVSHDAFVAFAQDYLSSRTPFDTFATRFGIKKPPK